MRISRQRDDDDDDETRKIPIETKIPLINLAHTVHKQHRKIKEKKSRKHEIPLAIYKQSMFLLSSITQLSKKNIFSSEKSTWGKNNVKMYAKYNKHDNREMDKTF